MKGFFLVLFAWLATVCSTSAWDHYNPDLHRAQTGNWVYYQPALTAQSAPFNFYEKPRIRRVKTCCKPRKCRGVRTYVRRVVYRPYDRNCCCGEERKRRWEDACWH